MDYRPPIGTSRYWGRALALFLFVSIGLTFALQFRAMPALADIHFNPFVLLTLTSVIANIIVLMRVSRLPSHVDGMRWFMLFVASAMAYGISETMQRISLSPAAAVFWNSASCIGITLIPISIYFFVLEYTGQKNRQQLLFTLFMISAEVFTFFSANGSLLYDVRPGHAVLYPWGYNETFGSSAFIIYVIWIGTLSGLALYRLIRFRQQARERLIRRQSLLFIWAIGIPIVIGIITDGILPIFGYLLMPTAVLAQTAASVLIAYGLNRYRLFSIDPEKLSSNILLTMNEAVIVTRPDYAIEQINAKAEQLLQVNPGEADGDSLSRYFDQQSWGNVTGTVEQHHASAPRLGNLILSGRRGRETPVRVVGTVLRETNDIAVYIFVVSDITELAASYQSLENKNRTLRHNRAELAASLAESQDLQKQLAREKAGVERTVQLRTRELVAAQDELKQAERLKSEFIALSSHNLRTPLTVFRGGLEMIQGTRLTKAQREVIDMISGSTARLERFVDDMLVISQLEAGEQLTQTPASIESVLEPLLTEAMSQAKAKNLAFSIELNTGDTQVACSSLRLQGAFRNILDNAFKFTAKGTVILSASADSKYVSVVVTDTGIGIPSAELPKVFKKFHRGTDVMQYDYEGEGLGLYLTKLIIDDHHGKITVDSKTGVGTTVTVKLPLAPKSSSKITKKQL